MEKIEAYRCERTGKIFESAKAALKSENILDRKKLATLKRRIKSGKFWTPKNGDYIYVPTRLYIDHGEDDQQGGLGLVTDVHIGTSGGKPCTFVSVAQVSGGYNWDQFHWGEQKKYMRDYGSVFAYPDPDIA